MSASVTTPCPICGPQVDHHQKLAPEMAIAKAIARGEDLGGVFEFGAAVAHARVAIGIDGDVDTMEAHRAARAVIAAQAKVAAEFARLVGRRRPCEACEMRLRLDLLIDVAANAVAEERDGTTDPDGSTLRADCNELAAYAGDDYPDPDATRSVLEMARDVYLAAHARLAAALAGPSPK